MKFEFSIIVKKIENIISPEIKKLKRVNLRFNIEPISKSGKKLKILKKIGDDFNNRKYETTINIVE